MEFLVDRLTRPSISYLSGVLSCFGGCVALCCVAISCVLCRPVVLRCVVLQSVVCCVDRLCCVALRCAVVMHCICFVLMSFFFVALCFPCCVAFSFLSFVVGILLLSVELSRIASPCFVLFLPCVWDGIACVVLPFYRLCCLVLVPLCCVTLCCVALCSVGIFCRRCVALHCVLFCDVVCRCVVFGCCVGFGCVLFVVLRCCVVVLLTSHV